MRTPMISDKHARVFMKSNICLNLLKTLCSMVALAASTGAGFAVEITLSNSIVELASLGTKNYTFEDPDSGGNVVVAVTMTPYSADDPFDVLMILDGGTRLGVGNLTNGGDGNWIESTEGVDFSARLVSASAGIDTNQVTFRIANIGTRAYATFDWTSSAGTVSVNQGDGGDILSAFDGEGASLATDYFANLRLNGQAQLTDAGAVAGKGIVFSVTMPLAPVVIMPDPRTNSWMTSSAGQYVRLYTNAAAKAAGVTTTTWTFSSLSGTSVVGTQAAPVYAGVQEVYSSSNWVYIRSSTMPAMPIGPLLAYSPAPLYLPFNQKAIYRIPRFPTNTTTKTLTGGGAIGYLVDGVQMFDTRDALSWTGSSEGMGTGYWTRDAYVNEGYGFDPVQGHASPQGAYHYHSNPQGLRYMLGDHVDYDPATRTYSESTAPVTQHSPILGWVRDGYPLYGPYGYSIASNSASGVRRMISGFVLRNGQNGTADLTTVGRTNIPPWAQRLYGVSSATGPSVASYGPLGRYLEDSDYLGDLTNPNTASPYVKGVDFDLDEYNGRWCVTPEFPNGTYAYFVTINEDGTPKYPYYIGRAFFGTPTGNSVSTLSETVVTNFVGGTNMPLRLNAPTASNGTVTLTWSAVEGGTYKVETSSDMSSWNTATTNARPQQVIGAYTNVTADPHTFYRVTRTAVATFDAVNGSTGGTANGISSISPTSGNRDTTFTLTINLNPAVNPPPQSAPVSSVTVGSITGTSNVHVSQTQVTSSITIPAGAATGPQTVTVTFPPPPGSSSNTVYTLPNGFTIQ